MAKKNNDKTYDSWEVPSTCLLNPILRDDSWMHYISGTSRSKVFHCIFGPPPQISRDFLCSFFKPWWIELIVMSLFFWSDKRGKVSRPSSLVKKFSWVWWKLQSFVNSSCQVFLVRDHQLSGEKADWWGNLPMLLRDYSYSICKEEKSHRFLGMEIRPLVSFLLSIACTCKSGECSHPVGCLERLPQFIESF